MSAPSLKDIRVIAFTWVWAGPWMGGVLADMGAEVIKIETRQRLDSQRVVKITKKSRTGSQSGAVQCHESGY